MPRPKGAADKQPRKPDSSTHRTRPRKPGAGRKPNPCCPTCGRRLPNKAVPKAATDGEVDHLRTKVIDKQADAGNWRRQFDAARDALDACHFEKAALAAEIERLRQHFAE